MPLWSIALPRPPVPSPRILRAVAPILAEMRARPTHAGPIVAQGLRAARSLGAKERPVAGDLLLGLIRHERALARIDPDPLTAWLRLAEEGAPELPDPEDAYAVALSLPAAIADEWWGRLGPEEGEALAVRLGGRAPLALRVLREPVDLPVPHRRLGRAIVLDGRVNVQLLDAWREGRVEVQDLGSQAIVEFVEQVLLGRGEGPPKRACEEIPQKGACGETGARAGDGSRRPCGPGPAGGQPVGRTRRGPRDAVLGPPRDGDGTGGGISSQAQRPPRGGEGVAAEGGGATLAGARILDLCAGAGGKSLALAALGARVQAWDVRRHALDELLKRAARARLDIRVGPPKGRYDLVLVDAPCSGTGVLRRHPENRWKLRFPTDAQAQLLREARGYGGRVVYATCALTLAENERLVRSVAEPLHEATVWPDAEREGFYMAEIAGE